MGKKPDLGLDKCPDCGYYRKGCDCDTAAAAQKAVDEAYEQGKRAEQNKHVKLYRTGKKSWLIR